MIHAYRQGGLNIVLDTCSGSIHVVDDLAFRVINLIDEGIEDRDEVISLITEGTEAEKPAPRTPITAPGTAEAAECFDEVMGLRDEGRLWSEDIFSEALGPKGVHRSIDAPLVKALCLNVSHACNLTCEYCFAGQGRYRGKSALMSPEVGRAALNYLVAHSGARHNLEVDFFGGEPLLNFQTVKELTAYARSLEASSGKRFRFTLTTNGMLIDDEVIDFVNREMSNVVLSLDGRREVHDRFRKDSAGRGSFDTVVTKFKRLVEARGDADYYIRGTFTHLNPDFLNDIYVMLDLGFNKLSMEPVVTSPGDPLELTAEDIELVKTQYEELSELMLKREREGRPFTFYHYMLDLKGGPCIYKRIAGCGSGSEYMAVTPAGDLYPCHQFVGDESFLMGDVWRGVTSSDLRDEFSQTGVCSREECRSCWARYYCAGGCAANACRASGSIGGIYPAGCELFKKRMECAVYLEAMRSRRDRP